VLGEIPSPSNLERTFMPFLQFDVEGTYLSSYGLKTHTTHCLIAKFFELYGGRLIS